VTETARRLLATIEESLGLPEPSPVILPDGGSLVSVFGVSDLAQASVGAAGSSLAALVAQSSGAQAPRVSVDRDLASAWFRLSIRPQGWQLASAWDEFSGDYPCSDGWIKLHTNAPRHREAALRVLGDPASRDEVARRVALRSVRQLETEVVEAGGAAAALMSLDEWREHPQGQAVALEPLVYSERSSASTKTEVKALSAGRPLEGLRVLDLTRVLAGPVATRLLAGWGAQVLRIDPPDWNEPAVVPEVTLGKQCARLDLRTPHGLQRLLELLAGADVLVHGYRPDALERLGLGRDVRDAVRPGLVDVSLDAYGWTGPWKSRRGFDSLVQMSSGIADEGRRAAGLQEPKPLPAQALDHATGYLMAASAIAGLTLRGREGIGSRWRMSLARTAQLLITTRREQDVATAAERPFVTPEAVGPVEHTPWGDALRLAPPLLVEGSPLHWSIPAHELGSELPQWLGDGSSM
jgi:crotonobetainyl-CoA:carnitine CoA-transferase CaiB-like acyl-CoA transferase